MWIGLNLSKFVWTCLNSSILDFFFSKFWTYSNQFFILQDEAEVPEHPDLPAIKKFVDINVFEDELSPSKKKNNCQLDNSRKINKANVDLVFHRNNLVLSPEDQQQDNITLVEAENQNISMTGASSNYEEIDSETDHDDVAIAKMTAYLNQQ